MSVLLFRHVDEAGTAPELATFIESVTTTRVLTVDIPAPNGEPLGYAFVRVADAAPVLAVFAADAAPLFRNRRLAVGIPPSTPPKVKQWRNMAVLGRLPLARTTRWAALVAGTTLFVCFVTARMNGHLPEDLLLVPISLVACGAPERHVYAVGMALVAALLLSLTVPLFRLFRFVGRVAPHLKGTSLVAQMTAPVTALALLVQGVVPLDPGALSLLHGRPAVLTFQSTIHQGAAALFFVAGTLHVYSVVNLLGGMRHQPDITRFMPVNAASYNTKYACLVALLLVPLSLILHPAAAWVHPMFAESFENRLLMAALSQYACVVALLVFFVSYGTELANIQFSVMLGAPDAYQRAMMPTADTRGDAPKRAKSELKED